MMDARESAMQKELIQRPSRRERMDLYEVVFFLAMWLMAFASLGFTASYAMGMDVYANADANMMQFFLGLSWGITALLAYVVSRMYRGAQSGIDLAKRRERHNAMQDEYVELLRVRARIERESLESKSEMND